MVLWRKGGGDGEECMLITMRPLLVYLSASHSSPTLFLSFQQDTRFVHGRHFASGHLGLDLAWRAGALGDGK